MNLIRTAPPQAEPLARDEAKDHLRLDVEDHDALVDGLIVAARERVEEECARSLITQTWRLSLDRFPSSAARVGDLIRLPRPPIATVTGITYVDGDGVTQTLAPSAYQLDADAEPARLRPAYGQRWPDVRSETLGAVRITYTAGYGADAADVPRAIRQAMLLLIGAWYENAEDVITGTIVTTLPNGVAALLGPYRFHEYA